MRKYLVVIERAGSCYSAYSLNLPGCIAETEQAMREAIQFHIDGCARKVS